MRKPVLHRWLTLTALLLVSLTTFAVLAYRDARQVCEAAEECSPAPAGEKGDMLIDGISRQFATFISIP